MVCSGIVVTILSNKYHECYLFHCRRYELEFELHTIVYCTRYWVGSVGCKATNGR